MMIMKINLILQSSDVDFFNESNELLSSLYVFFVVQKEHFVVIFLYTGWSDAKKRRRQKEKRSIEKGVEFNSIRIFS